ncbi:MAG TPA: hypothetical protein VHW23_44985 [Kofleriaceae bacterium]|jgi:hypothetical protein|nr:hypothetical protein [Kofleriaceae bacterium]
MLASARAARKPERGSSGKLCWSGQPTGTTLWIHGWIRGSDLPHFAAQMQ